MPSRIIHHEIHERNTARQVGLHVSTCVKRHSVSDDVRLNLLTFVSFEYFVVQVMNNLCLTCPTEIKVVGTFHVPFTEFLCESRYRGRHTECACYFCRRRHASTIPAVRSVAILETGWQYDMLANRVFAGLFFRTASQRLMSLHLAVPRHRGFSSRTRRDLT